jgi:hypothetical protein
MTDSAPARRRASTASRRHAPMQPELDFAELEHESTEALVARGSAYVREYARIEEQPTILLKNIAKVLVALRTRHTLSDGRMDLRGQGYEYRQDAASVYSGAGIPADSVSTVQSAVRYHINNTLHDEFDVETLASYKLVTTSALERVQAGNSVRNALVAAARTETEAAGGGPAKEIVANHTRLAGSVVTILTSLRPDHIKTAMTPQQRAALDGQLAAAQEHIRTLRRVIKSAGTD